MGVVRTIDETKCIGCGRCVADCVTHYLVMSEDDAGKKMPSFNKRSRCIDCGHCNAICPQGAINGGNPIFEIDENDTLLRVMAYKRSVRHFKKGSLIEEEKLNRIILGAQTAPTEKNRKSARILLIKDSLPQVYAMALDYLVSYVQESGSINPLYAPTMEMYANRDEILNNAEYLVVYVGNPSSITDAAISAERMQLVASEQGVGTLYRGDMKLAINNCEPLRELLGVRPNEEALVTFAMGETNLHYNKPAIKYNRKVEYR